MATKRVQLEDVLSTAEDLQKHAVAEAEKQGLKERGKLTRWYR